MSQPIDICERLDADAKLNSGLNAYRGWPDETAALEREAAAEIRRLRADRDAYKAALDVARDSDKDAAQLIQRGYRDGIEAAAQWLNAHRATVMPLKIGDAIAAIRALADAPAPDVELPGLERVQKRIRELGTNDSMLARWLLDEIAARGGTKAPESDQDTIDRLREFARGS